MQKIGGAPVTLAKVERILRKRWQWTKKQKPETDKLKKKIEELKKKRHSPKATGSKPMGGKKDRANKVKGDHGGKSCYCCGSSDHLIAECTDKKKLKKLTEVRKTQKECYLCGKKGHMQFECPLLNSDEEEDDEVVRPVKKKKALVVKGAAASKPGKKIPPSSRVEEVESDAENT